jgi:hypothetical protein
MAAGYERQAQSTNLGERSEQRSGKRGCGGGPGGGFAEAADAGADRRCWVGGGSLVRAGGVGVDAVARGNQLLDAV